MPAVQLAVNLVPILVGVGLKYMFFRKRGFARDYVDGLMAVSYTHLDVYKRQIS